MTRAQALQNRAFLKALRKTRNIRLACRKLGLSYSTMQKRRRAHPAFAVAWDAALVFADARLRAAGRQRPRSTPGSPSPHRTQGGEPVIVRRKDGTLQMRRARPGRLTREGEQAFLSAVAATANVRLAAAAVGAAHTSFYWRKRTDQAFTREMRLALQRGYEALEMALLEGSSPASHDHDDWRHNDPPAMPPMSVNQALQLMYLHQKAALLLDEPTPMRRRRGESREACCERLAQMAEARAERAREAFEVAEAERHERGEPAWGPAGEEARWKLGLPDLAQVAARSRAGGTESTAHNPERALFGGWRIEDMQRDAERRRALFEENGSQHPSGVEDDRRSPHVGFTPRDGHPLPSEERQAEGWPPDEEPESARPRVRRF